jgi:c(7)-type cytochrome triheme protein
MPMCLSTSRTRRNECHIFFALCAFIILTASVFGQVYLPPPPPKQPSDFGKVILNKHASTGPGPVVFDHWLHRSKFTCRLCHVDIGFAMEANATGIAADTNSRGFHCGACHDGKRLFEGRPIFASCSDNIKAKECNRCHSLDKHGSRQYEYNAYTAKFPKGVYGVDWVAAEAERKIKPVDFLEGISVKRVPIQTQPDFSIKAGMQWVHPIVFSHEKHSIWNGCELCHPEIFPTARKEGIQFSMLLNIRGRYCGACHGKVAFPLNNCSGCHPPGPDWVQ